MSMGPWGFDEIMVSAAVRYCLGRRTYIVHCCVDWLIENWAKFSEKTRLLIQKDVEAEFQRDDVARAMGPDNYPLGHDIDRVEWARVRALWSGA